jgi:hypothetical protein
MHKGIVDTLCVESLRHGTSLYNNLAIRLQGGLPSKGGSLAGSRPREVSQAKACIGYFHVFKDSGCPEPYRTLREPKIYTFLSSSHQADLYFEKFPNFKPAKTLGHLYVIASILTPTICFHYARNELHRFENDNFHLGEAYKSSKRLEPWRIGLPGALICGLNRSFFSEARANPLKVARGIGKIALAIFLLQNTSVYKKTGPNPKMPQILSFRDL